MKKTILLFLLLFPLLSYAENGKYGKGAVPETDGRVVFVKKIRISKMGDPQVFDIVYKWMKSHFDTDTKKIVYENTEKRQIAASADDYIVFKSSFLSLDRSLMRYNLVVEQNNGVLTMTYRGISYEYDFNANGKKTRLAAEQVITDANALTGKGDLNRYYGKFRQKTIDYIDGQVKELYNVLDSVSTVKPLVKDDAVEILGENAASSDTGAGIPVVDSVKTSPEKNFSEKPKLITRAVNIRESEVKMEGYRRIGPDKIPGNIIKMLTDDWMLITAGTEKSFNMMTASWGGLGVLLQKPVSFCFINPARYTFRLMQQGDVYTLCFFTEAYRSALQYCGTHTGAKVDKVKETGLTPIVTPSGAMAFKEAWMIVECRKLISQPLSAENINESSLKEEWSKKRLNEMFAGEILNVWVK